MASAVSQTGTPTLTQPARRPGEELAVDVNKLMDSVREEVIALMQDGVQKTASFCASLCAERIVAARREMRKELVQERQHLQRRLAERGPGSLCTASPAPSALSPASSAFPVTSLTPRRQDGGLTFGSSRSAFPLQPWTPVSLNQPSPAASTSLAGAPPPPVALPGSSVVGSSTPRANGPLRSPPATDEPAVDTAGHYDDAYISTYAEIQTLEERSENFKRMLESLEELTHKLEHNPSGSQGKGIPDSKSIFPNPTSISVTPVRSVTPPPPQASRSRRDTPPRGGALDRAGRGESEGAGETNGFSQHLAPSDLSAAEGPAAGPLGPQAKSLRGTSAIREPSNARSVSAYSVSASVDNLDLSGA